MESGITTPGSITHNNVHNQYRNSKLLIARTMETGPRNSTEKKIVPTIHPQIPNNTTPRVEPQLLDAPPLGKRNHVVV